MVALHPLTLQFRDVALEKRFRAQQLTAYLSLHLTVASVACAACVLVPLYDHQVWDIYLLGYLPFCVAKFPLFLWLTRNGGENSHHANWVLSFNLLCMILCSAYVASSRQPEARGGIVASFLGGLGFFLQTFQSHFYSPVYFRWALWSLCIGVQWIAPPWLDMDQTTMFAFTCFSASCGAAIAHCMDRGERLQFMRLELHHAEQLELEKKLARSELEKQARKVVNHTAKRVMANSAQACTLALHILEESDGTDSVHQVRRLLQQMAAEAEAGYTICLDSKSLLDKTRLLPHGFTVHSLFEALGLGSNSCFVFGGLPQELLLCAERERLSFMLFNAAQNALAHGAEGGEIRVESRIDVLPRAEPSPDGAPSAAEEEALLLVELTNHAGQNHDRLLRLPRGTSPLEGAAGRFDVLEMVSVLPSLGVGDALSTFEGLVDITEAAHAASASVRLWVEEAAVKFELRMPVVVLSHSDAPPTPAPPPDFAALPEGLVLIQADDDELARIVGELLVGPLRADPARSAILGETFAEVAHLPERVLALEAEGVAASSIILILDMFMDYPEGSITGLELCLRLRKAGSGARAAAGHVP